MNLPISDYIRVFRVTDPNVFIPPDSSTPPPASRSDVFNFNGTRADLIAAAMANDEEEEKQELEQDTIDKALAALVFFPSFS